MKLLILQKKSTKLVIITRGEKGAISIEGNNIVEVKAKNNLNIVDLTGAGDLFAAGYLHGCLNNFSQKDCLKKELKCRQK